MPRKATPEKLFKQRTTRKGTKKIMEVALAVSIRRHFHDFFRAFSCFSLFKNLRRIAGARFPFSEYFWRHRVFAASAHKHFPPVF